MASIHRQPGRPFWFAAFTTADGRRVFRSTKARDKKQAREVANVWERASRLGKHNRLTADMAREIIAAGVADVFAAANGQDLPGATIKAWCATWLETKRIENEAGTADRYRVILDRFTAFLGPRAGRDLSALRTEDIAAHRDRQARELSRASASLSVKVLRMCLGAAVKRGLLTSNPALGVDVLKKRGESKRRPFTVAEIKRILTACGEDTEWRGIVLAGTYLGQRLGDISKLTWRTVNLETSEVAFTTRKTGRRMILPLAAPLAEHLANLPGSDDPDAPLFPRSARATKTGTLSNRFRAILAEAGLVEARTHAASKTGRAAAREGAELSFHCLRHSATTFLKAAGVSDALAREIIGHDSAVVSRGYTHLSTEDLRRGIERLPDVTGAP